MGNIRPEYFHQSFLFSEDHTTRMRRFYTLGWPGVLQRVLNENRRHWKVGFLYAFLSLMTFFVVARTRLWEHTNAEWIAVLVSDSLVTHARLADTHQLTAHNNSSTLSHLTEKLGFPVERALYKYSRTKVLGRTQPMTTSPNVYYPLTHDTQSPPRLMTS